MAAPKKTKRELTKIHSMSTFVNVSPALKRLKKFREQLSEREMRNGISVVINQSLKEGRERAKQAIRDSYNIPEKYLSAINIVRSNASKLEGKIEVESQAIRLSEFNPSFNPSARTGVSFNVLKSGQGMLKYAFMLPGKKNVYVRGFYRANSPWGLVLYTAKRRQKDPVYKNLKDRKPRRTNHNSYFPVARLVTVGVYGAMNNNTNKRLTENYIERNLPKKLRTELQRRIDKATQ